MRRYSNQFFPNSEKYVGRISIIEVSSKFAVYLSYGALMDLKKKI